MALIQSQVDGHFLTFDDEKHVYFLDGSIVPGATDVKLGFPTSWVLQQWKVGKGAEYILDALTDLSDTWRYAKNDIWPLKKTHVAVLIKEAKNATKKILEDTADIGTFMHDYCHARRLGRAFDDGKVQGHKDEAIIRKRFLEVDKWIEERNKEEEVVCAEEIVGSPLFSFAGKFDVLVRRKDTGILRLQDYKSSKNFYSDQFIQEGGYRQAIREWLKLEVGELEIIRFNDNTEQPASMVIKDGIEDFTQQFITCRQTRFFQRKWEPIFDALYRKGLIKGKNVSKRTKKAE